VPCVEALVRLRGVGEASRPSRDFEWTLSLRF